MKEKLKAYIQLIRIPLFPIPIVTTLSGVALASEGNITWRGYLVLVVSMLGYFAGMMKNDYFHSETDAIVNPDKPIPSGRIPRKEVLVLASTTYIVCIILGMIINIKTGLLVMLLIVISHLYNAMFKAKGLLGSIDLPLGIASMNVFGSVAVSGGIVPMVWYAFAGVFLYDFGAHIATTFKDIEEDRKTGIVTTPIQIGVKPALLLSTIATIGAFVVFIIPYAMDKVEPAYLIWVGLSFGTAAITRLPLLLRQDQSSGYLALKGSMIGALALYPCLIGTVFSIPVSFAIILGAYMVSLVLLEITSQKV